MTVEEALGFTFRFIGYVVFELFLYSTARLVLPLVTLRHLRAAPLEGSWFLTPLVKRDTDGTRLVSPELAVVAGLLIWMGAAIAVFAIL